MASSKSFFASDIQMIPTDHRCYHASHVIQSIFVPSWLQSDVSFVSVAQVGCSTYRFPVQCLPACSGFYCLLCDHILYEFTLTRISFKLTVPPSLATMVLNEVTFRVNFHFSLMMWANNISALTSRIPSDRIFQRVGVHSLPFGMLFHPYANLIDWISYTTGITHDDEYSWARHGRVEQYCVSSDSQGTKWQWQSCPPQHSSFDPSICSLAKSHQCRHYIQCSLKGWLGCSAPDP